MSKYRTVRCSDCGEIIFSDNPAFRFSARCECDEIESPNPNIPVELLRMILPIAKRTPLEGTDETHAIRSAEMYLEIFDSIN